MRKLVAIAGAALTLAGCGGFNGPDLNYEVLTRTQCLTTTADYVFIKRESEFWNTGRIISVHFSRDYQPVLFVPGEDFIMYREIRKEGK